VRVLKETGGLKDPTDDWAPSKDDQDASPPHSESRHPEDPRSAFEATAEEVCDPEKIRIRLVGTGQAAQAIMPKKFYSLVREVATGIFRVRAGAILVPAKAAAGAQLQIVESTDKDVEQIVGHGRADGLKAKRIKDDQIPRVESEIAEQKQEVEKTKKDELEADKRVEALRDDGIARNARPGGLLHWVAIAPWVALCLGLLSGAVNTAVLQPQVSNVISVSFIGSYLVAAGLSATFELFSGMAGFLVASLRLPGRAAGALFGLLFLLIVWRLVPGLDALREGKTTGVTVLTVATLCSCYVSFATGYAAASWRDYVDHRQLVKTAGTALGNALDARGVAQEAHRVAMTKLSDLVAQRSVLYELVEKLNDSAGRADAVALGREADGIRADVQVDTINAVATAQVDQEYAAHVEWSEGVAALAYEKARAEELPMGDAIQVAAAPLPRAGLASGLTLLQTAAIAALGLGAIGGFVVGPFLLAVGAALATILLLPCGRFVRWLGVTKPSQVQPPPKVPPIDSPADLSAPLYLAQPDRMTPKYADGGAGTGQAQ
jgi:hypothetical protein